MVQLSRLPQMSPFYPLFTHVPDLPPTAHPPERPHTYRSRCPPGLFRRSPQRAHLAHPTPRRRRAQGDSLRERLYLGGPQCFHRGQWWHHDGTMVSLWRFARSLPLPHILFKDRWNVMGSIAHTRGSSVLSPLAIFDSLKIPQGVPILLSKRSSSRASP